MEFSHVPVLLEECMEGLALENGGIYIDGTIGGAGHSSEILKRTKDSKLIGIDRDTEALAASKKRLEEFGGRVTLVHSNFNDIKEVAEAQGIDGKVDGILIDLGVSSHQLDSAERGFSFRFDSPLDMRMDQGSEGLTAFDVVNNYSESELKRIFKEYGEERFAGSIARKICAVREKKPIETTFELRDIILSSVPRFKGHDGKSNVTRVFQAIRIEVNNELLGLEKAIRDAASVLKAGGRLAIISFHSLEDRIVKNTFKDMACDCVCPHDFPICVCNHRATTKIITNHPVTATESELEVNSRSSSAKLRVAEKL
ncbi:MAG: 16S rRNA (cytosine(1402)-N(4))-methyltransferase RsmH [Clostridia bacterium]|nr:16S rRNA (cytosine(1402)-N(4))-methyltransferase RsmH [Clostridia bacterium]